MRCLIKKLTIENFGRIGRLEQSFHNEITLMNGYENEIISAVCLLFRLPKQVKTTTPRMQLKTRLCADVCIDRKRYTVSAAKKRGSKIVDFSIRSDDNELTPERFIRAIRRNAEAQSLSVFCPEREDYTGRFRQYKDPEKYYGKTAFSRRTDGIGNTQTFRAVLNRFLEKPNRYGVIFMPNGEVITDDAPDELPLYMFLLLNEFWDEIEDIRNLNGVRLPPIISVGNIKEQPIKNILKSEKQLILLRPDL